MRFHFNVNFQTEAIMAVRHEDKATEAKMDPATLCRKEIITDRKVGALRMLPPATGWTPSPRTISATCLESPPSSAPTAK